MPRERSIIVCVLVPRFALRVAAGLGGALPSEPAALGPEPGGPPAVGEATAAAATFGVTAGMRVGEALARCPRLQLVTADPGAVADAAEALLQRLEEMGAAVESLAPGRALFCADGLVRLHGGLHRLLSATSSRLGRAGGQAPAPAASPPRRRLCGRGRDISARSSRGRRRASSARCRWRGCRSMPAPPTP